LAFENISDLGVLFVVVVFLLVAILNLSIVEAA
jgi:hypothetical protein